MLTEAEAEVEIEQQITQQVQQRINAVKDQIGDQLNKLGTELVAHLKSTGQTKKAAQEKVAESAPQKANKN